MTTGRITLAEALNKLSRYCAERERCHSEVRTKLISIHVYGEDLEEIISRLIELDFLNEERFARSYVSGKFRINKWGRNKIIHGLRAKQVPDYCIDKGLGEIDDAEYHALVRRLIAKQLRENSFEARQKVVASLQRKGFETGVILGAMRNKKENENEK